MFTLALVNQKGGCGKTTTAVNLAGALAAKQEQVVLVDLDPQAHATLALGCALEDEPSVAQLLSGEAPFSRVVREVPGEISLVPSSLDLAEIEEVAGRTLHPERMLAAKLSEVEDLYGYAVLDCPPRADGVLTANALRAADMVILVVETATFALQGAIRAMEVLEDIAGSMERRFEVRALATLFDQRMRLARELLVGTHAHFGELLFETVIHSSARLRQGTACGLPIQVLDPRCRAAQEFAALAEEILETTTLIPRSRVSAITTESIPGPPRHPIESHPTPH